ncbi:MAG: hypothetical protein RI955_1121 [Bacteroidota bacterium]
MNRRLIIILSIFGLTFLACIIYTIYLAKTNGESATIAILFAFVFVFGLALFCESIIFALIFVRHIKEVLPLLTPVFLITGLVPLYFLFNWYERRPVEIPQAGQLPVTVEQYELDKAQIIADYKKNDLDSNNVTITRDTVIDVKIDTIIYSTDLTKFFSIIIAVAKDGTKTKFCSAYRVGRKQNNAWKLFSPTGNVWTTCFDSIPELKSNMRQYYYKKYSINGSSSKPEIWTDKYIFVYEK